MSLLTKLDVFYLDHRLCGELDAGVDGPFVWIGCECGVTVVRRANEDDHAGRD